MTGNTPPVTTNRNQSDNDRRRTHPKERANLLRIREDDLVETVVKSKLFAGINGKGACLDGEDILVSVDGWHLGGNLLFGIFRMKHDGNFEKVPVEHNLGDIGDLARDSTGRLLFSDFHSDNIYWLPKGASKPTPLLRQDTRPSGPFEIACSRRGGIYFLNRTGSPPLGGKSAVYQIVGQEARLLFEAPQGTTLVGMDVSPGGRFAEGVYALISNGQLVRIDRTGRVSPVLSGMVNGRQIRFAPRGDLWVVAGEEGKRLYRIRSEATPEPMRPVVNRPTSKPPVAVPPAAGDVASIAQALGMTTMDPTAESLRHAGIAGGASVIRVAKRSVADRIGIEPGMILYHVDGLAATSPEKLEQLLKAQLPKGMATVRGVTESSSFRFEIPLPLHGRQYAHPMRAYAMPIPGGWFLLENYRNTAADQQFDTLVSPDGKHAVIIARSGVAVTDPVKDLARYEAEKLVDARKFQVSGLERSPIGGTSAFRVYYHVPKGDFVVSRMSFVQGSQRYVINVVSYDTNDKDLPQAVKTMIAGLRLGRTTQGATPRPTASPQQGPPSLTPPKTQLWTSTKPGKRVALGISAVSAGRPAAHQLGIETPTGAVISMVHPGSSAARAGLKPRDVIVEFASREINSFADLEAIAMKSPPDSTQSVTLVRGLNRLKIRWTLGSADGVRMQWYTHPSGGLQMRLPLHWKANLIRDNQELTLDEIASRDGEYRLFFAPEASAPSDLNAALDERIRSQMRRNPDAHRIAMKIGTEQLAGTAVFVKGDRIYWHYQFAMTFRGRLYSFHLYADPFIDGKKIPPAVHDILTTVEAYKPKS